MTESEIATEFFTGYTQALLARDVGAIAGHYAVPALVEFPGQAIAVTEAAQTEQFFAAALGQYAGVTDADATVRVAAHAPHSIWADVAWTYDDAAPAERLMYQLVHSEDRWLIAVLTPLAA